MSGFQGRAGPFSIKSRGYWDITWDPKMVAWERVHFPSHSSVYKPTHVQQVCPRARTPHTARKPRLLCVTVAAVETCYCSVSTLTAEVVLFDLNCVKEPSIFIHSSSPHNWARVTNCRLCEFAQFVLCEVWRVLSLSYLSSSSVTLFIFIETLNKTLQGKLIVSQS